MLDASATHFIRRPACPACGEQSAKSIATLQYHEEPLAGMLAQYYFRAENLQAWLKGGVYQLDRCWNCHLVFQRFVGDSELLSELYDRWIMSSELPHENPAIAAELSRPEQTRDGHELIGVAAFFNRTVSDLRVLDYGMGWGLWAQIAQRLGAQSFGYDLAKSRRDYAEARGVSPVSVEEIALLGADFVNTDQVFEHLSDPHEVMGLVAKALRPGGILKVSVPYAPDLARRLRLAKWAAVRGTRDSLHSVHPLEHVNLFDRRSLSCLAARSGLKPVSIPLRTHMAFALHPGAMPLTSLRGFAKAWARPLYHRFSQQNLYMWFQRSQS